MSKDKPHRIVHPAWAQWLDARDVAAALRVAEGEGWPPLPRPAVPGAKPAPRAERPGTAPLTACRH